jgi:acyl-CoA reductase-like NAD-dependent aldehyde dehydrogenase
MQIINPATETVIANIEEDDTKSLQIKLKSLQKGQKAWMKVSLRKRIEVISKFNDLLKDNLDSLAQTLTSEMGKPLQQAQNEIKGARARIKFFIENSQQYLKSVIFRLGIILIWSG